MNRISYSNTVEQNTKIAVLDFDGVWKSLAKAGHKVDAIKALRGMTDPVMGLKEAKEVVEYYMCNTGFYDTMYQEHGNSVATFKTRNSAITVKKNLSGNYVVTEVSTQEFYTDSELLAYIYALGMGHGAPSAH